MIAGNGTFKLFSESFQCLAQYGAIHVIYFIYPLSDIYDI